MLTLEQFQLIFPANKEPEEWLQHFSTLSDFGITSDHQVAAFCSQIGHESGDMTVLTENLNYSADALSKIFSKYFTPGAAKQYARQPEKIANRVYCLRMGNGNEASGDGWKYRGRGILQITGKVNYEACSIYLFSDANVLLDDPDLLKDDKLTSLLSALWYWQSRKLAELDDIETISRRVNGGTNGLKDRIERYERALEVLANG